MDNENYEIHVLPENGQEELEVQKIASNELTSLCINHLLDVEVAGKWSIAYITSVERQDGKVYVYTRILRDMSIKSLDFIEKVRDSNIHPGHLYIEDNKSGMSCLAVTHTYDRRREKTFVVALQPSNRLQL